MFNQVKQDAEKRMRKSIDSFKAELAKLRTGRAHPNLLEHIKVSFYGSEMPLNQIASVTVSDARTLVIQPWDKAMISPIEKAIQMSDLGLNPANSGDLIRVPLPALTEERRRDLVKVVKTEAENARVSIRNVRRDVNQQVKDALKAKKITEDEERRAEDDIQKMTDKFIAEVESLVSSKEKELMEV